ncbi:MAG: class I SAM-dependent methyltransferase [Clostridium sp.]|uniref:tRNA (adenine(22)-N(1))-methyltransferase n=1 Tax=Clostridium sp. TaxID=1506 RepID=UPI0025B7FB70|nr:class I SAM-dependent methyltransferase [Clostridium sp.]MCH3964670.1 class I SAM-dependent methyltransferase [Clostridium sp.]MCI1715141.1 class I SAM-dependent methyltransferase [Clostridium sp.]MCI1799403.1 class I SAM-dependent methyltransferase [Clostridium sp.]MCI1813324.1 class I SAM-dependent methyltransferase [Clostridium sp.]MCI1870215.1 class I SAM-dependent methyltransferase [Clostridium sp.]
MNLSLRLKSICDMVDRCDCMADIGTDHAYIPVYLVKNNICSRAIASDINKGPINKANINIRVEGLQDKIECRLGSGLNTITSGEAQVIVIAGMGGNLIRDIINENISVFKSAKNFILQPVQNPEVLRKYIYNAGFKIIDEDLCIDENIFYEIIKIEYGNNIRKSDCIFYEVGEKLLEKKHPLLAKFINRKIQKYENILGYIGEESKSAKKKKSDLERKIIRLQELIKCL